MHPNQQFLYYDLDLVVAHPSGGGGGPPAPRPRGPTLQELQEVLLFGRMDKEC